MSVTVAVTREFHTNGQLHRFGTITFDSSYPTGGESVTANNFKLGDGSFDLRVFPAAGYTFEYDKTNKKIKAFTPAVTTGATTAADSTSGALALNDAGAEGTFRVMGSAESTTHKLGAMQELANTVDLSAVVARFEAVGAY